jgi:hypothetical protein
MKTLRLNPKKVIISFCILVVGIIASAFFLLIFIRPIESMPVYVDQPTNAPPWVFAAAAKYNTTNQILISTNGWMTWVPFEDATNKFISETEIAQIKRAIPWNKTLLHLYLPDAVVIESPTNAHAEFRRQHIFLFVHLKKEDNSWHVKSIDSSTGELTGPPDWKQRIAASLPR